MINNVILVGRLVEKPKLTYLENNNYVATAYIAIERPYRDKQNEKITDFVPVTLWNGISKYVSDYLDKGDLVGLKCRLKQKKQLVDQTNIYSTEVICERLVLIHSKNKENKQFNPSVFSKNPKYNTENLDGMMSDYNDPTYDEAEADEIEAAIASEYASEYDVDYEEDE